MIQMILIVPSVVFRALSESLYFQILLMRNFALLILLLIRLLRKSGKMIVLSILRRQSRHVRDSLMEVNIAMVDIVMFLRIVMLVLRSRHISHPICGIIRETLSLERSMQERLSTRSLKVESSLGTSRIQQVRKRQSHLQRLPLSRSIQSHSWHVRSLENPLEKSGGFLIFSASCDTIALC